MQKKTNFKLNYIHQHIKNSKLFRSSRKRNPKYLNKLITPQLRLLKFYSPISVFRTIGDFCYLDQITHYDEYVPYTALTMNYKHIKEIKTSSNFTICTLQDSEEPFANIDFLCDRLTSLNDQTCFEMAYNIKKFSEKFKTVDIVGKKEVRYEAQNPMRTQEKEFLSTLDENSCEPMIIYHYSFDKKMGLIISKIGTNKVMKELTSKNDLQIFHEGLVFIPTNEYFKFMKEHLELCFKENNQVFKLYLNTCQGIFKLNAFCYQFMLQNELITILCFTKNLQEKNMQNIYDSVRINKQEKEAFENVEKKKKNVKNIEEWDQIIKKYYEPWIYKEGKERCTYKIIDSDQ